MTRRAETPEDAFARQLPEARALAGLSQQQLADRLEATGSALRKVAIVRIETGERGVSLNDALEIAAALGVNPSELINPREDGGRVRLNTSRKARPILREDFQNWLLGVAPLDERDRDIYSRFVSEAQARLSESWLEDARKLHQEREAALRKLSEVERIELARNQHEAFGQHIEETAALVADRKKSSRKRKD